MGWLIAISGSDGAGKSTLIDALAAKFESTGVPVKSVRLRLGFTPLIKGLKKTVGVHEAKSYSTDEPDPSRQKESALERAVWRFYSLGATLDLIRMLAWIKLQRAVGKRVITERYLWDNQIIYREKFGRYGWMERALWAVARLVAGQPDAAFMLILPAEESYRRVLARTQGVAEESLEVLVRRAQLYAELEQPGLVPIDAQQPPEQVFQTVWDHLGGLVEESTREASSRS